MQFSWQLRDVKSTVFWHTVLCNLLPVFQSNTLLLSLGQRGVRIHPEEWESMLIQKFIQDAEKLHAQTSWGNGGTKSKIYCEETVCRRCILAALWAMNVGLTKVGNQAKPLKYSGEKKELYFIPF